MRDGHVRLMAALVAAGGLHALLLSWPLQVFKPVSISNGPLHVELLKPSTPALTKPARPSHALAHTEVKQQQKKVIPTKKLQRRQTLPVADSVRVKKKPDPESVIRSPGVKAASATRQHVHKPLDSGRSTISNRQVHLSPQDHNESAVPHMPPSMSAAAQAMLLANIRYPRLARRRRWQGKGEFQLAIVSQSIRNITMLVSTGHAVLDRAVQRGLSGVDHIPVADGQYRLPVEFRLQ